MLLSKPAPKVKKPHKIVTEKQDRTILVTRCAQRGCKFFGKAAEQGVCFSAEGEILDEGKIAAFEKQVATELRQMRRRYDTKNYIRVLEAHYVCAMTNWTFALDEVVRLRRDNALLRLQAAKRTKRKA